MRQAIVAVLIAASVAAAATPEDGRAAYERRDDTMKQLGRSLYTGIGRVVQGRSQYGPDTVTAAEAVTRLVATLPTLFPPGSDVPPSRMRPELLATDSNRDTLIAAVQRAAAGLVPAVRGGDNAAMASAYKAVTAACDACHSKFRNDE